MELIHPLAAWIDARMTRSAFAKLVGTSDPHLSLFLNRKRGLSLNVALAIERETAGAFKPSDLQNIPAEAAE